MTDADHVARRPAVVFPPSAYIRDELDMRGWGAAELAARAGWTPAYARYVLLGVYVIDAAIAAGLAQAFGTSANLWLNLEREYRRVRID